MSSGNASHVVVKQAGRKTDSMLRRYQLIEKEIFWNCGLTHLWLLNTRKYGEKRIFYMCPPARLERVKRSKSRQEIEE